MPRRIRKDRAHPPRRPTPPPGMQSNDPGAELDADAVEFGRAIEKWKRQSGRLFPTCSETLAVLLSLGYRKVSEPATPVPLRRVGK